MAKKRSSDNKTGLVIFAGAGCSMDPPASLPGWNDLNDAILVALWDRLQQYNLSPQYRDKILTAIRDKRSQYAFPPDYQAQLMVERAGIEYFNLLSAVDSDSYNAVHYYTAILARAGMVKAVITTNFDRNFERAFTGAGVLYQSCFDEEGFNLLMQQPANNAIPLIKIHGCCSSPSSMIDTRKQRLKGRAKSLENLVSSLLQQHHFLFSGFSGADLDDNKNYLGLQQAAPSAKGFTYLSLPGSKIRQSMQALIDHYGNDKANAVACHPSNYMADLAKRSIADLEPFLPAAKPDLSIKEKLKIKVALLPPLDAANMLFALVESYGDEAVARYLYDKVWKNRSKSDYEGDAMKRFLLTHSRSYAFNFQNSEERAKSVEADILHIPLQKEEPGADETITNPAKKNLNHIRNTSAETSGLIGLVQTYNVNPILFSDFPKNIKEDMRSAASKTEIADIIYYYSFYALVYGDNRGFDYLLLAIEEMEADFDEPRLSQLLSRKALIQLRDDEYTAAGLEDATRARSLAEKYHEPHLLALSALALAVHARKTKNFNDALRYIQEAEKNYLELKRIPQYIESIVEYLKIIMLGFEKVDTDKQMLLKKTMEIRDKVNEYVVEKINAFEPEYCYLTGMILSQFTDTDKEQYMQWFVDAVSLSEQYEQDQNTEYYKETCRLLGILDEVEQRIRNSRARRAGEL